MRTATIPGTSRGFRALEAELLARIGLYRRPVTLREMFSFSTYNGPSAVIPAWAYDACDNLLIAGAVIEDKQGRLRIV